MKLILSLICIYLVLSSEHGQHGQHGQKTRKARKTTQTKARVIQDKILRAIEILPGSNYFYYWIELSARRFMSSSVYYKTFISVMFISLAPTVFLLIIPVTENSNFLLRLMVGYAAGCLLGDSFLHLIPHAYDHQNSTQVGEVGTYVILGIFLFYFIEKFLSGLHYHSETKTARQKLMQDKLKLDAYKNSKRDKPQPDLSCSEDPVSRMCGTTFLGLLADAVHNFMDGAAIASSFLVDTRTGLATTFSVFFHEIPHEISDFAVLLKSGIKPFPAILLQLVTALGALSGACLTLYIGSALSGAFSHAVPSLTAGGFIYIACVNLIPASLSSEGSVVELLAESSFVLLGLLTLTLIE